MTRRFGRNPTELCLIFNKVVDIVYHTHQHCLKSWDQPFLSADHLHNYALAVHQHGAPLHNCFGFVDGTVRIIARPKYYQRIMYNGHKRVHSMKFQSVVLPNGLIAYVSGPYEGKRHDSTMLNESGLLPILRRVAFYDNEPLCIYGDPAYPLGVQIQGPFKDAQLTLQMRDFNKGMSEVRIAVEWMFEISQSSFLILLTLKGRPNSILVLLVRCIILVLCLRMLVPAFMVTLFHPFLNFYHLH
jgi:hypothetical protein